MDKEKDNNLTGIIYSFSKSLVKESRSKEEVNLFDDIWEVMSSFINKWIHLPPEDWPAEESANMLLQGLGIAGPTEALDLVAPKIIGVTASVLWHISSSDQKFSFQEIRNLVPKYCEKYGASGWLKNHLVNCIPALCDVEELDKIKKPKIIGKEKYVVIVNGKSDEKTPDEIDTIRTEERKNPKYEIWIDEHTNEIFFLEQNRRIQIHLSETLRKVLISIVRRYGLICSYADLDMEVWKNEAKDSTSRPQAVMKIKKEAKRKGVKTINQLIESVRGEGYRFIRPVKHCIILKS